eukprot:Nitzschia sp. Nitz4//scaffold238_size30058//19551//20594//NITZ4_008003-RA/size30058-augustus-gene-0.17-mRNA-1//-1//CDS//3329543540//5943//frame0
MTELKNLHKNHTNMSQSKAKVIFHNQIGNDDVLLGRGTGPNGSRGNIKYRSLVRQVLEKACGIAIPTEEPNQGAEDTIQGSVEKSDLAGHIVRTIKGRGGRFLQKVETKTSPSEEEVVSGSHMDCYVEVDDSVALNKTKQTFRHQMRIIERAHATAGTPAESPASDRPMKRLRTSLPFTMDSSVGSPGSIDNSHSGCISSTSLPTSPRHSLSTSLPLPSMSTPTSHQSSLAASVQGALQVVGTTPQSNTAKGSENVRQLAGASAAMIPGSLLAAPTLSLEQTLLLQEMTIRNELRQRQQQQAMLLALANSKNWGPMK